MEHQIPETELILNNDGSVYHLHLLPEDIAETIIFVGDQERVPEVSKYFDSIELKKSKREFVTHTGNFSNGITTIQCMYAPEFTSHSEGIRVNVE